MWPGRTYSPHLVSTQVPLTPHPHLVTMEPNSDEPVDVWSGEYGTNFAIPGFLLWVRDMKLPYFIAEIRGAYVGKALISETEFKEEMLVIRQAFSKHDCHYLQRDYESLLQQLWPYAATSTRESHM